MPALFYAVILVLALLGIAHSGDGQPFTFAIIGDRTGGTVPGVYGQVWRELASHDPAFVITTGDAIEGSDDTKAPAQWQEFERILAPYKRYPLYPVPGNHDIWSAVSERLFRQHTGKPLHYSFDHGSAHFTMLDNSRSEQISENELSFLETDLKAHAGAAVKFVFSHRPSWIVQVAVGNPSFALHQLARGYGVRYVIAGHVHQLLNFNLQGVTYVSMPSSGGHLRASGEYDDGRFFGYALVKVSGTAVEFEIHELKPPYGKGRTTRLADWGMLGLLERPQHSLAPAR